MSSPPPPGLQLNLPKKRPPIASSVTSQPAKKRQATHPLRQTSYPVPDASHFVATPSSAYARSETGSIASGYSRATASLADGAPGKRGRGRPRKVDSVAGGRTGAGASTAGDDAQSLARGGEGTQTVGQAAAGGRAGPEAADQDDDEEDELGEVEGDWAEWEEREMKLLEILIRAFTPEQDARYSAFKRVKFKESILKRIVNQIVSQSVTKAPLIAINAYSKLYAGEIIERAREVQEEHAKAYDKVLAEKWRERDRLEEEEKKTKEKEKETNTTNGNENKATAANDTTIKPNPTSSNVKDEVTSPNFKDEVTSPNVKEEVTSPNLPAPSPPKPQDTTMPRPLPPPPYPQTTLSGFENPHRGGLLPDHLREAVRRYRQDGEGGGVGFDGLSLAGLGVRGRASARGGAVFGRGGRGMFR